MPARITIVSGLPRSGTSLLMQMLQRGGIEPLTDGQRTADADNPRGYLELEAVKRLRTDNSWVKDARGKAIKVVSQHLANLPGGESYHILWMHRDLDEVLMSQEAMIVRRGGKPGPKPLLKAAFEAHLTQMESWLAKQPHVQALTIDYSQLVSSPQVQVGRIAEFLEAELDLAAMVSAVDRSLYRNRTSPG